MANPRCTLSKYILTSLVTAASSSISSDHNAGLRGSALRSRGLTLEGELDGPLGTLGLLDHSQGCLALVQLAQGRECSPGPLHRI